MTLETTLNPNPDLVFRSLLANDLTAFTEFAFGVVRPGIPLKSNWHLEALTYKLSQVARGEILRLHHHAAPAQPQISKRISRPARVVPRP